MKLLSVIAALLIFTASRAAHAQSASRLPIGDKAQIVRSILSRTNFQGGETKREVCLSTRNIPDQVLQNLPRVDNVQFVLIAPSEIEEGGRLCSYTYWEFGEFQTRKSSVLISFVKVDRGGAGFMSYVGSQYAYRKVKGRWLGKRVGIPLGMS